MEPIPIGVSVPQRVVVTHERTILMPHEYLAAYERWMLSTGKTPRTRGQRLRMATHVLERWPEPGAATAVEVVDWLSRPHFCEKADLSQSTRATYHSDARAFFAWLVDSGHLIVSPMDSKLVQKPRRRKGLPSPLSAQEEIRALDHAHGNMRAWLLLALRAGLRASEIAAFSGESIEEEHITLRGKGERAAMIPTHRELWTLAQEYPRRGWWFPSPAHAGHISGNSVSVLTGRFFRSPEVDIPRGSIHRARHSCGTTALDRSGGDLRYVQQLLRHSSSATTDIYTQLADKRLRDVVDMLGSPPSEVA